MPVRSPGVADDQYGPAVPNLQFSAEYVAVVTMYGNGGTFAGIGRQSHRTFAVLFGSGFVEGVQLTPRHQAHSRVWSLGSLHSWYDATG
jgi:hypothetical protein